MPDLPDDLRALLRHRADDAPAVPAPTPALVRAVRRRQAVRTSLAVGGCTAGVVGVVALVAASVHPTPRVVSPAAPATSSAPVDDRYESCTGPVYDDLRVSVHPTELKFAYGCYRVRAGAASITFTNPQSVPHDLVVKTEAGVQVARTDVISAGEPGNVASAHADLVRPLVAGDYTLTCSVHPQMHAQLVVR